MKRIICLSLIFVLVFNVSACNKNGSSSFDEFEPFTTHSSKDSVDEFMDIIGKMYGDSLYSGYVLDKKHCFNVTPTDVAEQTNFKIFKFSDSCASFVMIGNAVYMLCESFGGYGYVNAVPCDFDNDGNKDLLVASSWGSGVHRSQISVFNGTTYESTMIYESLDTDLVVVISSSKIFTHNKNDNALAFAIWSVDIDISNNNFANLSYTIQNAIGTVESSNEGPIFVPYVPQ